uniref:Trehalose-phosphate synthase 1 n=1 Tax=Tetraselmis sp. GSL018 TaxID=582737 RepID=A0A061SCE1_9CHLO
MLGVDRLDMIKGIPQKLLAYEKFLEEHPEWRDKVLLVQIAVPSRTDVPEYQKLRSLVHEIVGRINGKFGTLTHVPIHHLDRGLAFIELCALYSITDVLLVTSLRDGMNLVSYEYVACQSDNAGVLVLSEFAGAAQSLGSGALLVNPWNIIDVSQAIGDALSMSDTERRERHRQMYVHVTVHTAQAWADTFISELNDTHVENELRIRHVPPRMNFPETVKAFQHAKGRRLIVLGYNATLTQAREAPLAPKRHFDQIKAETKVNSATCEYIQRLAAHPAVTVVIMSGSDRARLLDTFSNLEDVWLVAENGIYMRPPLKHSGPCGGDTWICNFPSLNSDWLDAVQLVFEYFCERTPRSYVEVRESSIVWSYKYADAEFGRLQARDLLQHLCTGPISNAPVDIIQGSRSVEVRPVGVSKGVAMLHMLSWIQDNIAPFAATFDYVLAIGHYLGRDENLYTYLEGHGVGSLQREQASPHLGLTSFGSGQWYNDLANSFSEHDTRTVSPEENSTSAEPLPLLPKPLSPLRTGKEARANDSGGGSPAHQKQPLAGDVRAYASPMAWRRDTRSFDDAEPCNPFKSPSGHRPSDGLREPPNHQKFQARNPREPLGAEVATMKLPPRHLFTCNIGKNQSRARYLIDSSKEVEELLLSMVEVLPDIAVPLPTLVRSESQRSAPDSGNCNSAPGSPLGARGRLRMRRSSFYC